MKSTRKIIENSVLSYLKKHEIPRNSKIISAFSGGPDSTVLLSILSGLNEYGFHLTAAYYNHRLRSERELTADEAVIRRQAQRLGIQLVVGTAEPGKIQQIAREQGLCLEEAARNVRYDFLYETKRSFDADYIALGHNINDNSETILMRFLQNSGIAGLSGIPEKRGGIIRPLCGVNRELVEELVKEEGLEYCTDRTNLENHFLRNKMRLDIIPIIKRVFPEFDRNMAGLSDKMKQNNDFIESEAAKRLLWQPSGAGWKIPAVDFYAEHELIRIKSLYSIMNRVSSCKRIRYSAVEQAVSGRIHENGKLLLRLSDAEVFTGNDFIFVDRLVNREKNSYLLNLKAGMGIYACGQRFLVIESIGFRGSEVDGAEVLMELVTDYPLVVRSFREGDSIETEAGRKSLKKIFNEWKIKSEDKYRIPVVENSSRILAVVGRHLGYDNKKAPMKQNAEGSQIKILLIINSDTEIIGE